MKISHMQQHELFLDFKHKEYLIDSTKYLFRNQKKALLYSRAKGLVMNPQITLQLTSISLCLIYSVQNIQTMLLTVDY